MRTLGLPVTLGLLGASLVAAVVMAYAGVPIVSTADLPLQINGSGKMGWMMLWPHARPWKLGAPEPMLRAVPDGARVAAILSRTLADAVPDGRRLVVAGETAAPGHVGEVQAA